MRTRLSTFAKESSLSLFFGLIFVLALVGQGLTGHADNNNRLVADGFEPVTLARYLTSSDFVVDVAENWQSEYLQFLLFILATVWFVQKGSPESKELDKAGPESDKDQKVGKFAQADSPAWAKVGGFRQRLYSWSLGLTMGAIFLLSWLAQSIAGQNAFNEEQIRQLGQPLSWPAYVGSAEFWNRTFQNWQSEFLAVASMVAFGIYLRQRGSPESKPVGEPHDSTGVQG